MHAAVTHRAESLAAPYALRQHRAKHRHSINQIADSFSQMNPEFWDKMRTDTETNDRSAPVLDPSFSLLTKVHACIFSMARCSGF